MTITAEQRAERNRQNARKSTGPRTQEGKDRSRFNAVKHGFRASLPVLPGEDPGVYQARLDGWVRSLQPANEAELFLVERAVHVSWQIDRADRVEALRLFDRLGEETVRQAQTIAKQGEQLFRCPGKSIDAFPNPSEKATRGPISWPSHRAHPEHPASLLASLETTVAGCSWLLERWRALGRVLDAGCWRAPDRLRAVRLLGHQPADLLSEPAVWTIYLACEAIEPGCVDLRREVLEDFQTPELQALGEQIARKFREEVRIQNNQVGRDGRGMLRALVDSAIDRLEGVLRTRTAEEQAGLSPVTARMGFDASDVGQSLRRHQASCERSLFRTLDALRKVRRQAGQAQAAAGTDTLEAEPAGSGPDETSACGESRDAGSPVQPMSSQGTEPVRGLPENEAPPEPMSGWGMLASSEGASPSHPMLESGNEPDRSHGMPLVTAAADEPIESPPVAVAADATPVAVAAAAEPGSAGASACGIVAAAESSETGVTSETGRSGDAGMMKEATTAAVSTQLATNEANQPAQPAGPVPIGLGTLLFAILLLFAGYIHAEKPPHGGLPTIHSAQLSHSVWSCAMSLSYASPLQPPVGADRRGQERKPLCGKGDPAMSSLSPETGRLGVGKGKPMARVRPPPSGGLGKPRNLGCSSALVDGVSRHCLGPAAPRGVRNKLRPFSDVGRRRPREASQPACGKKVAGSS